METLPKLTPTQALLLRAAARRADGRVIPPANLRGGARVKVLTGATNLQLMLATGWQPHFVRGAISGLLRERLGLNVVLTRNAAGERVYLID